ALVHPLAAPSWTAPANHLSIPRNHGSPLVSTRVLQHIPPISGHRPTRRAGPFSASSGHCRHSLNGVYGISTADRPHSALMLRARMTLPHFSVSSAISFPNSAGEGNIMPPRSARRTFILGSARAALTSLLSLSMIAAGVFLDAPTPNHPLAS